ncbi:MAG: hypothetical protein HOI95_29255, partial [Chromatiales bacterium]|nr:hypothetical protein [Chromatiales bacterium]
MPPELDPPAYAALTPTAQCVAECLGVAYPSAMSRTDVTRKLADLDLRESGRRITAAKVNVATDQLVQLGLVGVHERGILQARKRWANVFMSGANRNGRLFDFARSFGLLYHSFRYDEASLERTARYSVISGEMRHLPHIQDARYFSWGTFAAPESAPLLERLTPDYLAAALTDCLRCVINDVVDPSGLLPIAQRHVRDLPEIANELAFLLVLQGDFAGALAVFDHWPDDSVQSINRTCLKAFIATIQGEDEKAQNAINEAIAQAKHGTRKRNVFPDNPAFAVALVALVRRDTLEATELLVHLLSVAKKQKLQPAEVLFAAGALSARDRDFEPSMFGRWVRDTHAIGLQCCWREDFSALEYPHNRTAFFTLLVNARHNGFRWLYAEAGAILEQMGADQSLYLDTPDIDAHIKASAEERAALRVVPFAEAVRALPPWEVALKGLEQVAHEVSSSGGPATAKKQPLKQRRLVWHLDLQTEMAFMDIAPREQGANRDGSWNKGRAVSLKRLATRMDQFPYLTDQDRAAVARIRSDRSWGGANQYFLETDGLYELAGHPHVFNGEGETVDVVQRKPYLKVDKTSKGALTVRLSPYPDYDYNYQVEVINDRCVEVTHFTRRHQQLLDIIPADGVTLPMAAQGRLLDAVATLAGDVQVRSSLSDIASTVAEAVRADAEPWVLLVPADEGLSVSLVVDPIPGSATLLAPGTGDATMIARLATGVVQTTRDLRAEEGAAAA